MVEARRVLTVLGPLVAASCAPLTPPGMVASSVSPATDVAEASRSIQPDADLALVVAFPASACTSTESAVFLDEEGRFLGAVAPGTEATLPVRPASKHVFVVGSFDVIAPPRTWFARYEVARRSDQGVLVEVGGTDRHNCMSKWSGPLAPRPEAVSLEAAAKAAQGLRSLQVNAAEGGRWFEEHRERVEELVGRAHVERSVPQPVVTQTMQVH